MAQPEEPGIEEARLVDTNVNRTPNGSTESDEEQVLRERCGELDPDGVYRGEVAVR